ncbi:hypothetical protein DFP79_1511 [Marinomonas balearica]|uniref:Uncharacterized protein n=1 Tax=Marinomonas balearica TaxID=491947 RepID=A0A4R6MD13_9GAMM|nr:hypothetical protein DFP79_1511 [Marinomonas balearica]
MRVLVASQNFLANSWLTYLMSFWYPNLRSLNLGVNWLFCEQGQ